MGKGKRSRDNKAVESVNNAARPETKNSVNNWTRVMLIVVAVILVASLALIFIQDSGIMLRAPHAFKSENFEINGAMMQYLFRTQYNDFYSTYYSYMSYLSLSTSKPLREQQFGASGKLDETLLGEFEGTWFEYFWSLAEKQARSVLIYCEAAKAASMELDDEAKADIDKAIDSLKDTAKQLNYPNTKSYVYALYGEGVKTSDVRDILEMTELAAKYYEQEIDRILEEITDDDVLKFFDENRSDYLKADYLLITFEAKLDAAKKNEPTDVELKAYESAIKEAKEHANKVASMKSIDEIKEYMAEFWFNSYYDSYYKTTVDSFIKDKKIEESDKPSDEQAKADKEEVKKIVLDAVKNETEIKDLPAMGEEKFDDVLESLRDKLINKLNSDIKSMLKETVAYSDKTDESKWIFAEDRAEGDVKIFSSDDEKVEEDDADESEDDANASETESDTATGTETGDDKKDEDKIDETFTATVYYIVKPNYLEDELVREFGHILISGDSFKEDHSHDGHDHETDDKDAINEELDALAKAEADRILAEFLKGEKTKENFDKLAKDKNEDGNEYYEDTKPGDMVTEMNDWLFEEGRQVNDTAVIKTQYGYHVTWLISFGKEVYFVDSKNDLYNENVEKWYEELEKATPIDENEKIADKIN